MHTIESPAQCAHPFHAIQKTGPESGKCHGCGAEVAKGPNGWFAVPQENPCIHDCIHDCSQIEVISDGKATCLGCGKALIPGIGGGWVAAPFQPGPPPHFTTPLPCKNPQYHPVEPVRDKQEDAVEHIQQWKKVRELLRESSAKIKQLRQSLELAYAKIEGFEIAFQMVHPTREYVVNITTEPAVEHAIDKFLAEP